MLAEKFKGEATISRVEEEHPVVASPSGKYLCDFKKYLFYDEPGGFDYCFVGIVSECYGIIIYSVRLKHHTLDVTPIHIFVFRSHLKSAWRPFDILARAKMQSKIQKFFNDEVANRKLQGKSQTCKK